MFGVTVRCRCSRSEQSALTGFRHDQFDGKYARPGHIGKGARLMNGHGNPEITRDLDALVVGAGFGGIYMLHGAG